MMANDMAPSYNGMKHGTFKQWSRTGAVREQNLVYVFSNDLFHGKQVFYNVSVNDRVEVSFNNGKQTIYYIRPLSGSGCMYAYYPLGTSVWSSCDHDKYPLPATFEPVVPTNLPPPLK